MSAELAIPEVNSEIVHAGWWHEVAQPVIEGSDWDDLDGLDAQLKAYIAIFETLGREDKIELEKARRVVEKRRGELLGEAEHGGDHGNQHTGGKFQPINLPDLDRATKSRFRKLARCWPVIEPHLLRATNIKEVRRAFLLDLASEADEDPDAPTNGTPQKLPVEKRAKQIARLAEKGYTARQISDKIGVSFERVQQIANEFDVDLPLAGTQHRIDPNQVIENVVTGLEASAYALDQIKGMEAQIDPEQVEYWATSLDSSFRRLRKLRKTLKEVTQ